MSYPEPVALSLEDIDWIRGRVGLWLELKQKFEGHSLDECDLQADAAHSALLFRLLSGKEPLPEPPKLEMGYPMYPKEVS